MRRMRRRLPAALDQRQPRPNSRSRRTARAMPSAMRSARSRASARRRWSSWSTSATRTGRFASLDDFAARIDPRLLNRRQIESLAGGGAFDGIAERWAVVRRGRDHPRRRRQRRRCADQRAGRPVRRGAGQRRADPHADRRELVARPAHGRREGELRLLFLGPSGRQLPPSRRSPTAPGRFAELAALPAPADGGRTRAVMAGLVEDTRWRTSARGPPLHDGDPVRFARASSRRPSSTTWSPSRSPPRPRRAAARCSSVELDRRPGEETPRVTIRSLQSVRKPRRGAAGCSSRSRSRTRRRSAASPPRSPASAAATASCASSARFGGRRGRSGARPRLPARRRARRADRADRGRRPRSRSRSPKRRVGLVS